MGTVNVTTNRRHSSAFGPIGDTANAICDGISLTAGLVADTVEDLASARPALQRRISGLGKTAYYALGAVEYGVRSGIANSLGREIKDEEWTCEGIDKILAEQFHYKPEKKELPGKEAPSINEPKQQPAMQASAKVDLTKQFGPIWVPDPAMVTVTIK